MPRPCIILGVVEYDPQIHHRRSTRLAGYDYSQAGAYFITVCTHNRDLLLQVHHVQEVISSSWHTLPVRFPSVTLDEFVTMPNHMHGIIILRGAASGTLTDRALGGGAADRGAASGAPTLGRVVCAFKSVSAVAANNALDRSGQPFWQRNYYEHVIRDEEELNAVRRYIRENPLKWSDDPDNPANL